MEIVKQQTPKEYHKKWRENNKNKIKRYNKKWKENNGEKYYKENKEKIKIRQKEYRNENAKKLSLQEKDYRLKKQYGISLDKYNEMLKEQNENCSICGRHQSEFKIPLAVDHCHKTDKVRGLLCMNCNQAIGKFNDDINILASAISYLQQ